MKGKAVKKLLHLGRRRDHGARYCESCGSACDSACRAESVRNTNVMMASKWTPGRIV
jgi:hypothetical protein